MPGLVPGIQLSAGSGASGRMDPGDPAFAGAGKHWDDLMQPALVEFTSLHDDGEVLALIFQ